MIPYLSAADVFALLSPADAVAAVIAALRDGLDPAAGVPRSSVPLAHGDMLLMPAESATHAGVKLATVAPANAARGLPRISALYAVFDAETLQPTAVIDGTALTTLRTPAVSVAAVRALLPPAPHVVVFGAGPQAIGHVSTLTDVTDPMSITVVTRSGTLPAGSPGRPPAAASRSSDVSLRPSEHSATPAPQTSAAAAPPHPSVAAPQAPVAAPQASVGTPQAPVAAPQASVGTPQGSAGTPQAPVVAPQGSFGTPQAFAGTPGSRAATGKPPAFPASAVVLRAGTAEVDAALQAADLVVCATTARTPLFDSALLYDSAIVIAVGSHEPDAREVDAALCARATVIVEDRATALRECGDVIIAIDEGALTPDRLLPMSDVVRGTAHVPGGRPVLFKGSGMSWQDLVIAEALLARAAT